MTNQSVSITERQFKKIKHRTANYKGTKFAFNIRCNPCGRTVFTNSQVIEGNRTENEQKDFKDWLILCSNCWEIIDSGKEIIIES